MTVDELATACLALSIEDQDRLSDLLIMRCEQWGTDVADIEAAARRAGLLEAAALCDLLAESERRASPDERIGDGSQDTCAELALRLRALAARKPLA